MISCFTMQALSDQFTELTFSSYKNKKEVVFLLNNKEKILEKLQTRKKLQAIAENAFNNLAESTDAEKELDLINFAIISFQINKKSYGLDCRRCMITRFPKTLFTEKLTEFWARLEGLYLEHNNIASLPAEISSLKNLKRLNLGHNCLQEFPESITSLTMLELLVMRSNNFSIIPTSISALQKLKQLHLDTNKIESIPPSMSLLQNITELDFSRNKVRTIPPELCQMSKLTRLWLEQNPLEAIPPQIANKKGLFISLPEQEQVQQRPLPRPQAIQKVGQGIAPQEQKILEEKKAHGCPTH